MVLPRLRQMVVAALVCCACGAGAPAASASLPPAHPTETASAPASANAGTSQPAPVWPSDANTGVPAGVKLAPRDRSIVVNTPGTVIDGLELTGGASITVAASNVTIERSRIRCTVSSCYSGSNLIFVGDGPTNVLIQDVELDGMGESGNNNSGYAAVGGGGFTCRRCNIHGIGMGFAIWGAHPVTIEDSYVHDLYVEAGSHNQDIYVNNHTAGITIRHNTLFNQDGQTATILLDGSYGGPVQHVTVDRNLLDGGGYELYGGGCPSTFCKETAYVVVTDNRFGRKFFPKGGYWGPLAAYDCDRTGMVWQGNTWEGTEEPVSAC